MPKPAEDPSGEERLHSEIGRLKMENEWLKKSWGVSAEDDGAAPTSCTIGNQRSLNCLDQWDHVKRARCAREMMENECMHENHEVLLK